MKIIILTTIIFLIAGTQSLLLGRLEGKKGNAVYSARVFLSLFDTIVYNNECENSYQYPASNESKKRENILTKIEEQTNVSSIKVYPNPTKNEVIIEYKELEEDTYFELYDLIGNKLIEKRLDGKENKQIIYLINIRAGIYIYKIMNHKKVIINAKLVIFK